MFIIGRFGVVPMFIIGRFGVVPMFIIGRFGVVPMFIIGRPTVKVGTTLILCEVAVELVARRLRGRERHVRLRENLGEFAERRFHSAHGVAFLRLQVSS